MIKQSVTIFVILILAASAGVGATSQGGTAGPAPTPELASAAPTLEAVVAEALERSAELAALRDRIAAAEAMVRPASALPDPMASFGLVNIPVGTLALDEDMMSGVELMLSQGVPQGRKRRLRREVQSQEAVMLSARYAERRNALIRDVKQTYFDLQYLDAARAVVDQNKLVATDLLESAEAHYATGMGLQQDVFKAQVRLSQMIDMEVMLRQERAAAATRLNRLLYRPGREAVPRLPLLELSTIPMAGEPLGARAEALNPRLAEMRARVAQAASKVDLAEQGIRPDFTFGFRYMVRQRLATNPMSGEDMWSATVGVNLPWVYRRDTVDQEVVAMRAEQGAEEADLAAMRNELAAMVEETVIGLMRSDQQLSLVETALLPQSEGALASSRAAYETGQLEFMSVMDNQMSLYNLQLQQLSLIAEHERKQAALEYLVGGPLAQDSVPSVAEVSSDAR